jgi:TRAP-type mannitol/chloroaromatic compound transport system permease large subunit
MGFDPLWYGVLLGINLQTSFLTPPFGFALFYLRGVAPPEITTGHIYRGIIPFVIIQLVGLALVASFPALATWLPRVVLR